MSPSSDENDTSRAAIESNETFEDGSSDVFNGQGNIMIENNSQEG